MGIMIGSVSSMAAVKVAVERAPPAVAAAPAAAPAPVRAAAPVAVAASTQQQQRPQVVEAPQAPRQVIDPTKAAMTTSGMFVDIYV